MEGIKNPKIELEIDHSDTDVDKIEMYTELVGKVYSEMDKISVQSTVEPAAQIMLFNFFRHNPNPDENDLERMRNKIVGLSSEEERYKSNPKIPTIGTELEFDGYFIDLKRIDCDVLNMLKIPNYTEKCHTHLHEVAQKFSYSSHVQMRVLQELRSMNLVNFNNENVPMSLHINLGLPKDVIRINVVENAEYNTQLFVSIAAIAFCSTERIFTRKSTNAFIAKSTRVEKSEKTGSIRLELKPFSFENNSSYRMIDEVQMLSASLFAVVRERLGKSKMDETDKTLSLFWKGFIFETERLLNEYVESPQSRFSLRSELNPDLIAYLIERNPDLVKKARALITSYSNMIKELLFKDQDTE